MALSPREENALVSEYMPIVYSRVKKLGIKGGGFDDAVQEGRIAVMKAIRSFKPDQGAKLSTWIFAKVGWALKDWMDVETRIRSGKAFVMQHGGDGNRMNPKDQTVCQKKMPPSMRQGFDDDSAHDNEMTFQQYLMSVNEGRPEAAGCVEAEEAECLSVEIQNRLREALAGAPAEVQVAAESLMRGETIAQTAKALGKGERTAWTRRKQVAQLLEPLREKLHASD